MAIGFFQYGLLFALACGSAYLAFFRYETAPRLTTGVATVSWAVLSAASSAVVHPVDGPTPTVTLGYDPMAGVCLLLALASGFAFIGAVLGRYPTEEMDEQEEDFNDAPKHAQW